MTEDQAMTAVRDALLGIAPEIDFATIDPGAPMRDSLDLDSIDFLSLVEEMHSRCGVEIPETDYEMVDTLDRLVAYLVRHPDPTAAPTPSPAP